MKFTYKWGGVTVVLVVGLALAGHAFQITGMNLAAQKVEHSTEKGQARLQARVGRTYWVRPNRASTYQFVRFGDTNTADSILHGAVVDGTRAFTVVQLVIRPNSDSGTYQVRFADGTLKWMDDAAFVMHLDVPGSEVKTSSEIFDQDPMLSDARLRQSDHANVKQTLGPDAERGPSPSDPVFGMTESEVSASNWGKPDNAVVVQTPTGLVSIWSYAHGHFLAFRNGRLEEVLNTSRGLFG